MTPKRWPRFTGQRIRKTHCDGRMSGQYRNETTTSATPIRSVASGFIASLTTLVFSHGPRLLKAICGGAPVRVRTFQRRQRNSLPIDCPVTGSNRDIRTYRGDIWALEKVARLRLWPLGSPGIEPGRFVHPLKQCWCASLTQMGNEPTHVDGGETRTARSSTGHAGLDFGSCEGLAEVVATSDGLVVLAHGNRMGAFPF